MTGLKRWYLKSCPKCKGDMYLSFDDFTHEYERVCLLCNCHISVTSKSRMPFVQTSGRRNPLR